MEETRERERKRETKTFRNKLALRREEKGSKWEKQQLQKYTTLVAYEVLPLFFSISFTGFGKVVRGGRGVGDLLSPQNLTLNITVPPAPLHNQGCQFGLLPDLNLASFKKKISQQYFLLIKMQFKSKIDFFCSLSYLLSGIVDLATLPATSICPDFFPPSFFLLLLLLGEECPSTKAREAFLKRGNLTQMDYRHPPPFLASNLATVKETNKQKISPSIWLKMHFFSKL